MERTFDEADLNVVVARCGFLTDLDEPRYRAELGALPASGRSVPRLGLARFLVDTSQSEWSGFEVYGVSGPASR